jgi:ribonuclease P protein component
VLSRPHRLTRGDDYKRVVRRGSRCAGQHTVTHLISSGEGDAVRFGFIVGRQVGGAVVRNTIRRRLKDVCARALPTVRPGTDVVIRALPSAAGADFATLRSEVDRCLRRVAA